MTLPKVFNTVFLSPIVQPPPIVYSNNLVLIGSSEKGTYMEPIYCRTPKEASTHFGAGRLAQAYTEAYNAGAQAIYLFRINNDGETLTPELTYERLATAYQLLSHFAAHIIVPLEVSLWDTQDFSTQLAEALYNKESQRAIGVIATRPKTEAETWDQYFTYLVKNRPVYTTVDNGEKVDLGQGLNVVVPWVSINFGQTDEYTVNGAVVYGGLLSALSPHVSPTNKPLLGVGSQTCVYGSGSRTESVTLDAAPYQLERVPEKSPTVMYNGVALMEETDYQIDYAEGTIASEYRHGQTVTVTYDYDDVNTLVLKGYVLFRNNRRRGIVPVRGVTFSSNTSSYYATSTNRVVLESITRIEAVSEDFIGHPYTDFEDKLFLAIDNVLQQMVDEKKLDSYEFEIVEIDVGELEVDLDVVPIGEVVSVRTQVRLQL